MAASDATHIFAAIPLIIRTTIKSRIGILIGLALSLFYLLFFIVLLDYKSLDFVLYIYVDFG